MRRREFITGGMAAVGRPFLARAQQPDQMRRIGVLMAFAEDDVEGQARLEALKESLGKLGWSEQNIRIVARWGGGSSDQLRKNAVELVVGNPEIIVVSGSPALQAIKHQTQTIPVVFANAADPVVDKLVTSLSHPGGNITGYTNFEEPITGKWLEILKEVVPTLTDVLVLYYPDSPAALGQLRTIRKVAATFRVQLVLAPVTDGTQIEEAIKTSGQRPNSGLIIFPDANIGVHRFRIISLAERYRLPAIYPLPYFVKNGGLISYGVDPLDLFRRSASYVDRILRGEKPAVLPIQGPTKFDLVVNLKAAKAIGLTIPESFLLRADEVIE